MRLLLPLIILGTAIGVFMMVADPIYQEVKELRTRIVKLDDALVRSKDTLALRDEVLERYNSITPEDLKKVDQLLPQNVSSVRTVLEVSRLATQNLLVLKDVTVAATSEFMSDRDAAGGEKETPYGVLNLEFTLGGSYESFRNFLSAFEKSIRLPGVTALSFTSPDNQRSSGIVEHQLTVQTRWFRSSP